jgi:hypothetical protein
MASPMREKRAWPPRDKEAADSTESVAAFEASVAVVKQTVVTSGEVLSSANEDLNDHQRWLEVQSAAVQADRARHDRWLQRQRERQEAIERREHARARRKLMRQRAMGAVKDAASAAFLFVRSVLWFVVGRTIAGLNYIDALAASGLAWIGARLRDVALSIARHVSIAVTWVARQAAALGLATGKLLSAAFFWCAATARALAGSIGRLLAAGFSRIAAKVRELTPSVGRFLSICFSGIYARAYDVTRSTGRLLAAGFSASSAKAHALAGSTGRALAPAFSAISAKAYAVAPSLAGRIAKAGQSARDYAREGAGRAQGLFQTDKFSQDMAAAVAGENEVSSPRRVARFDLSQMLIIAGTLLLVVGGLMLGGGLILRAGTPSQVASSEAVAWLFQQKDLPIAERSVFAFVGTQAGLRIKGFSISAVNNSDQPLRGVEGIIKPDVSRTDLKLAVSVDRSEADAAPEALAGEPEAKDAIPAHAPFKLVFAFPAEAANGQDGVTAEEVLATFGGVMLKVRYEAAGKQKTFIEYLSPEMLKAQLVELQAEANGS